MDWVVCVGLFWASELDQNWRWILTSESLIWAASNLCHCSLPIDTLNTNYPSGAEIFVIIITNTNGDQRMKLRQVHSPFFTSCNPYVSVFWMPREEARVCTYSAPASFSLCVMTVGVLLLAQIAILIAFLNWHKPMLCQDFVLCTAISVHSMSFLHCNYAKDMTCCLQLANTFLSSCDTYTCVAEFTLMSTRRCTQSEYETKIHRSCDH